MYDDSLSYYEVLCKAVAYINKLIDSDKEIISDIEQLRADLAIVQKWIADYNTEFAEKVIADYIATTIFFGLTADGYFVAYIPKSWKNIEFRTVGYDIDIICCDNCDVQPGTLVLYY